MSPRKKKKPLLTRIFGDKRGKKGGTSKGGKKGAASDKQSQEPPRTRLQRSIAEMKQMKQLGEKDPGGSLACWWPCFARYSRKKSRTNNASMRWSGISFTRAKSRRNRAATARPPPQ